MLTSAEIAAIAAKALDDKKARDIKVLKTDKQTVLADYFVICNGAPRPRISRRWSTRWTSSSPRRVSRPYAARVCAPIYGC